MGAQNGPTTQFESQRHGILYIPRSRYGTKAGFAKSSGLFASCGSNAQGESRVEVRERKRAGFWLTV